MKKSFVLIFVFLFSFLMSYSQSHRQMTVLDNYCIKQDSQGAVIGKVISPYAEKISLSKDTSTLFMIDKRGFLKLKDNKMLTAASPESYCVTIKVGKEEKSFELVKDNFIKNGVVAHRGAWKNQDASQNSLKALRKAIEIGCEASEFDVWLSADNHVILSHDPEIGGKRVEETDAAELMAIPLKDGDSVPSLQEYLLCVKQQNKTRLVLEVKASQKGKGRSETVAEESVKLVHKLKAQAWVDYITFDFDAAVRIRELDPTALILYLEADKGLEELKIAGMSGIDYHYSNFLKDPDMVSNAKEIGLLTNAWTVNKEEDLKKMLDMDIDYITTDEPELLLNMLKNR